MRGFAEPASLSRGYRMDKFFQSLVNSGSPFGMIVMVVLIGSLVGVISTIASQIRLYATHRADANLKREMVERGLSAEEIERIIAAKSPGGRASGKDVGSC